MSKDLVHKAIYLLQEDTNQDKSQNTSSSPKRKKVKKGDPNLRQKTTPNALKSYEAVDRTEANLKILDQLRCLKPKSSSVVKVLKLYTKPTNSVQESEKVEKQKSILFDDDDDDDDDDDIKKRKKRKI